MKKPHFVAFACGAFVALALLSLAAFPDPSLTTYVGNFYGNAGGITNASATPWTTNNSAAGFNLTQLAELDMTNNTAISQTVLTGTNTTITVVVTNDLGGVSSNIVQIGTSVSTETNAYVLQSRSGATLSTYDTNGNLIIAGVLNGLNFQTPTNAPADGQIVTATGTGGATKYANAATASQTPVVQDINVNNFQETNAANIHTKAFLVTSNTATGPQTGQLQVSGQGNISINSTNHPLIIITNSVGTVIWKYAETNNLTQTTGSILASQLSGMATNYVAANWTPIPGFGFFIFSNNACYCVTVTKTNLVAAP